MIRRGRRRINPAVPRFLRRSSTAGRFVARRWRRSLQLRVVVSTMVLSLVVLLILGFVLTSQITDRLLDLKLRAATEEIDRARVSVERDLSGGDSNASIANRLQQTRSILTDRDVGTTPSSGVVGTFDTVLLAPGGGPRDTASVGPIDEIPENLTRMVRSGRIAYRYSSVSGSSGRRVPALISCD